jgi:type I restriction enzyme S subunit
MKAQEMRNAVLQLAIQGKLVPQDPADEPTSALLEKINAKKEQLIKDKKIRNGKPLPEITDIERPFDIPDCWEWVRIGEIGQIVGGGTPKTDVKEFWVDGSIPWITPADMSTLKSKYVYNGQRFITVDGLKSSSSQLLSEGSVVYSSRAPIGYIAIAKNPLCTNQGFKSVELYDMNLNLYLYFCL